MSNKDNTDMLKMYLNKIDKIKKDDFSINRLKEVHEKLPSNLNSVNMVAIDSLNIGSTGKNISSMGLVLAHIKEIEKSDNDRVFLAGDLFYYFDREDSKGDTSFDFDNQVTILTQMFEPIKDKIVGLIPGMNEKKIEKSYGVNPMLVLAKNLGLKDKYASNGINLTLEFNNKYTDKKSKEVTISCSNEHSRAKSYRTVYNKGLTAGKLTGESDINIIAGTHKAMKADSRMYTYSKEPNTLIKVPHYEIATAGYTMYDKKGDGPCYVINSKFSVYVAKNLDAKIKQGKRQMKEVEYKVFCDSEVFEKQEFSKKQYNVIADYFKACESNDELTEACKKLLDELSMTEKKTLNNKMFKCVKEVSVLDENSEKGRE